MRHLKFTSRILIIIGITICLYPIFSNILNSFNQKNIISKYKISVQNLTDNQKKEIENKYNEYNKSHIDFLDVDEMLAYINIPKINVNLPIYYGTSKIVLSKGVGNLENTSLPTGGKGNHCVLVAHTGLTRAKMFDDINKLQLEDEFYIHVLDNKLKYKVNQIKIVAPENTQDLIADENEDYITLVTCTPYMINSHRLLVRGTRVFEKEKSQKEEIINSNIKNKDNSLYKYFISLLSKNLNDNIMFFNTIYGVILLGFA